MVNDFLFQLTLGDHPGIVQQRVYMCLSTTRSDDRNAMLDANGFGWAGRMGGAQFSPKVAEVAAMSDDLRASVAGDALVRSYAVHAIASPSLGVVTFG